MPVYTGEMHPKPQKLYCYVDETGQDTQGRFFLVAIIISGEERENLIKGLEKIEKESLKGISKWRKVIPARRFAYLQMVLKNSLFLNKISYAAFSGRKDYQEMTIIATAKAIVSSAPMTNYEASVYIDGLGRTERYVVGAGLRHRHIKVKRVRGMTDESSALIRLTDAIAGFVRDYLEGDKNTKPLYEKAISHSLIKKL